MKEDVFKGLKVFKFKAEFILTKLQGITKIEVVKFVIK